MTGSIIQIVPRRTDQPDGVGDYATILANAFSNKEVGYQHSFRGRQRKWSRPLEMHGSLSSHSPARLLLSETSGRSLQKDEASCSNRSCFWLRVSKAWSASLVAKWDKNMEKRKSQYSIDRDFPRAVCDGARVAKLILAVECPELRYPRVVASLRRWIATNQAYSDQLAVWRPNMRDRLKAMPVFSNVGEPDVVLPPAAVGQCIWRYSVAQEPNVGSTTVRTSQVHSHGAKAGNARKSLISV